MMGVLTTGEVLDWMQQWYPPSGAADWDRVGLVLGSRASQVRRILLAVDPVDVVAKQALATESDLVITHHPLYLRGTSFLSEEDAKGRLVADLVRGGIGLFTAHTNADVAHDGVAQALADLLELQDLEPMEAAPDGVTGYGRIGNLREPMSLEQFAQQVAAALPAGPNGLLVGGDLDRRVERVAVSGGSGDSFLNLVSTLGVDAFVTADLRHHPASEHLEDGGPALLCGSHWATEWPWLPVLARRLEKTARAQGYPLEVIVSTAVTEPWTAHFQTTGTGIVEEETSK